MCFAFNSKNIFSQFLSTEFHVTNSKRNQVKKQPLSNIDKEKKTNTPNNYLTLTTGYWKINIFVSCADILVNDSTTSHSHNTGRVICVQICK